MGLARPALRLLLRARAESGKEIAARLAERRGIDATPRPPGRLFWLHAASVGETMSILPVLTELGVAAPRATALVTTGTVTSARLLAQRVAEQAFGLAVLHRFVPLDVPAWVARFLDHWRPDAAAFVESELWPNMLTACRTAGLPAMLVNARLSARSAARWAWLRGMAADMLADFAVLEAQSAADADRLRGLGAVAVATPGNLKFAAPPLPADEAELTRLRAVIGERPVWLAASTHPGEDEIALAAHCRLAADFPGLLTIVAPRHPERGPAVAATLHAPLRSRGEGPDALWVADTLGELGLLYRLAPVTLVGRSLIPPGGGQNPLEPARLGCAIAVGPYTANFAEAVAALEAAGGIARVRDDASLAAWIAAMWNREDMRAGMATAARAAADRYADLPRAIARTLVGLAERRG
ncbi:MAG: 3-deoxy-D-manno-octulosonic acid transferase [Acidobacteria bacterium]|nr:3-deoxy-D-manno-octulosonic acid transferase [Acidobacteriota bacterium]